MPKSFSISVIITTYNRKAYIERAVRSVLKQTRPADEILIIDDGSDDGTRELVQREYPEIRYHWQENLGISAARNEGIKRSDGEWIAFLDCDDEWLPSKLEKQIAALSTSPDYRICHTNEIWIRNGRRVNPKIIHQKFGGMIFEKCLPLCMISPSSVLIQRDVFNQHGMFDTALPACEDYDFWLRVCAHLPVLYVDEPQIIKYGGHADQLSQKHWGMDRFRIYALEKIIHAKKLNDSQRQATLRMLLEKIDIFLLGARKRGNDDVVGEYEGKRERYLSLL